MNPAYARELLSQLDHAGYEAWLVGGCVRDRLMGTPPHDYDIATAALPAQVAAVFADCRLIETGLRHGTVTVLWDGVPFEITTFRCDAPYADHRHPDAVAFTRSLREDLARRDFTINAIAMDSDGKLCDPFGGEADIRAGCIRCVGDPAQRFDEDALRIMRALRFSAVLGFAIEAKTAEAIFAKRSLLRYVSAERLAAELGKLLCGKDAGHILLDYADVLAVFLPELTAMKGFDQRNYHHIYDVLEHTAHVVDAVPPELPLRLAALFHDSGKPAAFSMDAQGVGHFFGHAEISCQLADAALRRLRFDNATRLAVEQLVRYHDAPIACNRNAVRRALNKLGLDGLRAMLCLKRADNLAQSPAYHGRQQEIDALEALTDELLAEDACFRLRDLAVSGRDLLALGYHPGSALGAALQALLDGVLSDRLPNDRAALLHEAGRMLAQAEAPASNLRESL